MTPLALVTESLQKIGPCSAEEIDQELEDRLRFGLLDRSEWPRGSHASSYLRALERSGHAVVEDKTWRWLGVQLPRDAVQQLPLFEA